MSENNDDKSKYESVGDRVSIFRRGTMWYANFQLHGRQHREALKTRSKKEARRKAFQLEASLIDGSYEHFARAPTIAKVVEDYLAYHRAENHAPKTISKLVTTYARLQTLCDERRVRTVAEITVRIVDAYRQQRADEEAKPRTILNETVIIRQLVNFALSRSMLAIDPLKNLKIKKPKPTPQPCWNRTQIQRILAAALAHYRPAFTLLAETGMRIGELKHLTWNDIDFATGRIHIRPKDNWKPKTGDQRAVPMSPVARSLLECLPRRTRWVFTAPSSVKYPKGDHQISERRLLQHLKRLLKRLGLVGHLHTFRHSFISDAIVRGTPEAVVRTWVGHVDRDVLAHYTHIADRDSQAAMERLTASALIETSKEEKSTTETKADVADGAGPQTEPDDSVVGNGADADSKAAQLQHSRAEPSHE